MRKADAAGNNRVDAIIRALDVGVARRLMVASGETPCRFLDCPNPAISQLWPYCINHDHLLEDAE